MPSNRAITEVIGPLPDKQAQRAIRELKARKTALLTWGRVSFSLSAKFNAAYLWQVAAGRKAPSRRLVLALGIVKPEKRTDVRIRMTVSDAREIVDHDTMPVNVKNRIRYALWGVK
jgi:hypothetical protein